MLDGNEIQKSFGAGGSMIVDVDAKGVARAEAKWDEGSGLKAGAFVEVDILDILKMLAAKTDNKIDDALVGMIASALGR
jgi:hypothetical protein